MCRSIEMGNLLIEYRIKEEWYGTFLDFAITHDKLWMAASKDGELLDDRHVCVVSSQHVLLTWLMLL